VSKSVARLERRLGVRLLQRSTRTLNLTTEGAAYYERVAPLLRAIADAEDIVQMADNTRGLLRVTAPVFVGRTLIGAWSEAFLARHPNVKLELSVTDRHVDLIREGFDVALRIGELPDMELTARKLGQSINVIVASPDYLARRGVPRTIEICAKHACLRYLLAGRSYPFMFGDGTSFTADGPLDSDERHHVISRSPSWRRHRSGPAVCDRRRSRRRRLVEILPDLAMPKVPMHVVHAFGRQLPVRARLVHRFSRGSEWRRSVDRPQAEIAPT